VPRIRRTAGVVWEGNLARGTGTISAGTGAFSGLPYSLPVRVGAPADKTSPEELLAAAHAGCFGMSLAGELTSAGSPPERLDVTCTVTMDEVEGQGHLVVDSTIEASARVAGIDAEAFRRAVEAADAGCSMSALIRASAAVSVNARLEEGRDGD
jgi:osmotically inducible protein OsmC